MYIYTFIHIHMPRQKTRPLIALLPNALPSHTMMIVNTNNDINK